MGRRLVAKVDITNHFGLWARKRLQERAYCDLRLILGLSYIGESLFLRSLHLKLKQDKLVGMEATDFFVNCERQYC